MTTQTTQPLPVLTPAAAGQTEVGNYFVANYPPFAYWKTDEVKHVHDVLAKTPAEAGDTQTPLGLYVHIPYCRKRCHFCYFRVYTDRNAQQIRDYLDAVVHELEMYGQRPLIQGRRPKFVYFGGGTPSYLSIEQLGHLFDGLRKTLPWEGVEEVTFECEPGTLNEKKLQFLRDQGVTRLSLGVENFNQQILELNNRAHGEKEIDKAYNFARHVGFPQVNIDLIAGMLGETPENWRACVERAVAMRPESVTIYQMEVPFNTTIYKEMKAAGKVMAPVADWATKRRWVSEAFAALEQAGYTVGSAYTAISDARKVKFVYRDALWSGADMLGLGVASFSHLRGVHFQNQHDEQPYIERVRSGELPIYRGLRVTKEELLIREFVLQLKLGHLEPAYFARKYGVDVLTKFGAHLAELEKRGFLKASRDRIELNREGLLQVDSLLHGFFLPQHQGNRYA